MNHSNASKLKRTVSNSEISIIMFKLCPLSWNRMHSHFNKCTHIEVEWKSPWIFANKSVYCAESAVHSIVISLQICMHLRNEGDSIFVCALRWHRLTEWFQVLCNIQLFHESECTNNVLFAMFLVIWYPTSDMCQRILDYIDRQARFRWLELIRGCLPANANFVCRVVRISRKVLVAVCYTMSLLDMDLIFCTAYICMCCLRLNDAPMCVLDKNTWKRPLIL